MQNSRRQSAALFGALVVGGTLGSVSCGGATQASPQASPQGSLRTDVGDVPTDMRSDYESFASNCSKCHGLERALAAPVTDNHHWDVYVAKMMRTAGSAINASEAPHILRFLYWYTDHKKSGGGDSRAKSIDEATPPVTQTSAAPMSAPPAAAAVPQEGTPPAPTPSVSGELRGESAP